jgi:hypothetical protein
MLKFCKNPNLSWSLFVKKINGKPEPIWCYHRFSGDMLSKVYPFMDNPEDSDYLMAASDGASSGVYKMGDKS